MSHCCWCVQHLGPDSCLLKPFTHASPLLLLTLPWTIITWPSDRLWVTKVTASLNLCTSPHPKVTLVYICWEHRETAHLNWRSGESLLIFFLHSVTQKGFWVGHRGDFGRMASVILTSTGLFFQYERSAIWRTETVVYDVNPLHIKFEVKFESAHNYSVLMVKSIEIP